MTSGQGRVRLLTQALIRPYELDARRCISYRHFAGTPLMRPKREGLLRNAAVAAGNRADPAVRNEIKTALKNRRL
ncbi:MAG: hypothetical protein HYZ90_04785 [Candidatus Omnitrophica bacterium]|nr:hypothetical protein [Candidatus Omnitrophota bacterium]